MLHVLSQASVFLGPQLGGKQQAATATALPSADASKWKQVCASVDMDVLGGLAVEVT